MESESPARMLKIKYSANRTDQAINRAIRAELMGGDACLDAMALVHELVRKLDRDGLPGATEAIDAHRSLKAVAALMASEIRRRYGL